MPALLPIATLVLGIGAILSTGVLSWLNGTGTPPSAQLEGSRMSYGVLAFATGVQILAGIAAIVLTILGLIGFDAIVLDLVALLALGSASVLSGASATGRLALSQPHSA